MVVFSASLGGESILVLKLARSMVTSLIMLCGDFYFCGVPLILKLVSVLGVSGGMENGFTWLFCVGVAMIE
jgi:hypothetical protein